MQLPIRAIYRSTLPLIVHNFDNTNAIMFSSESAFHKFMVRRFPGDAEILLVPMKLIGENLEQDEEKKKTLEMSDKLRLE